MPWKECKPMDERLRFIARLLEGEKMAGLCREFGISRVTGYKIFNRYKDCGLDALNDRSRSLRVKKSAFGTRMRNLALGFATRAISLRATTGSTKCSSDPRHLSKSNCMSSNGRCSAATA